MTTCVEFNVGTVWSDSQLVRWSESKTPDSRVGAVFGSRTRQFVGHGRAPADVPEVTDERIVEHARIAQRVGIEFLYLLNGLCRHLDLDDNETKKHVVQDLEWVVEEVQPDSVVVADLRLATILRSRYGPDKVGLRVSTIAGVRRVSDLEPWIPLEIDGVVLHHDGGRDFDEISHIVGFLESQVPSAQLELLVNESCVHECFAREAHYSRLAKASLGYTEGFQQNCNIPRFLDPSLILGARWIRPEDLDRYARLGVCRFKIAGREMSESWLDRAVRSYMCRRHEGNLIELFTMTPPGLESMASDIVYIDNRALDGLLASMPVESKPQRLYWKELAAKLWEMGALKIHDPGSSYELVDGRLQCTSPGKYLSRLQEQRVDSDLPFKKPKKTSETRQST